MEEGTPRRQLGNRQRPGWSGGGPEALLSRVSSSPQRDLSRSGSILRATTNFIELCVRDSAWIPEDKINDFRASSRRWVLLYPSQKYGGTGWGFRSAGGLAKINGLEIRLRVRQGKARSYRTRAPVKEVGVFERGACYVFICRCVLPFMMNTTLSPVGSAGEIADDQGQPQAGIRSCLFVEDDVFAQSLLDCSRKKGYKGIVAVMVLGPCDGTSLPGPLNPLDIQCREAMGAGGDGKNEQNHRPSYPCTLSCFVGVKSETRAASSGAVDFMSQEQTPSLENMDSSFGAKLAYSDAPAR